MYGNVPKKTISKVIWAGKGALDAILSQINKKIGDRFHWAVHNFILVASTGLVLIVSRRYTMSPGTGVDPGTSKTGRRLSPSAFTAVHTYKLAKSMPTSASCLRPLKA